jgi:hypothetical protein
MAIVRWLTSYTVWLCKWFHTRSPRYVRHDRPSRVRDRSDAADGLRLVNGALFVLKGRPGEPRGRFDVPRWVPAAGSCGLKVKNPDFKRRAGA